MYVFRFLDQEIRLLGLTKNGWIIHGFIFLLLIMIVDIFVGLGYIAVIAGTGFFLSQFPRLTVYAFIVWPFLPRKRFGINVQYSGRMILGRGAEQKQAKVQKSQKEVGIFGLKA